MTKIRIGYWTEEEKEIKIALDLAKSPHNYLTVTQISKNEPRYSLPAMELETSSDIMKLNDALRQANRIKEILLNYIDPKPVIEQLI